MQQTAELLAATRDCFDPWVRSCDKRSNGLGTQKSGRGKALGTDGKLSQSHNWKGLYLEIDWDTLLTMAKEIGWVEEQEYSVGISVCVLN